MYSGLCNKKENGCLNPSCHSLQGNRADMNAHIQAEAYNHADLNMKLIEDMRDRMKKMEAKIERLTSELQTTDYRPGGAYDSQGTSISSFLEHRQRHREDQVR